MDAPADVTVTEPLYVPALRPAEFTETLTLPGVEELPAAISHVPPEAATVYESAVPLLLIASVFAAGVAPPCVYENARLVGLSTMVGVGGGAAGMTVMLCLVVPVPPPAPSMAAP